jgi:hypothetical protein
MRSRALAVVALAAALAVPTLAAAAPASLLKVLSAPIASAKKHRLKVLLPSTISAHAAHLYSSGGATARGYDIQLASAPNCNDANACYVAEFLAAPGQPISGAAVTLVHGIRGRYAASACGASCNPATIQWAEYGLNYTIEYIGSKQQMIALADSAITAGPR